MKEIRKKIISAALASLMAVSCVGASLSSDAAEIEDKPSKTVGTIKFDSGDWHSSKMLFYIWDSNGKHATKNGWVDADPWGSPKKLGGTAVEGEEGVFESFEFEMEEDTDYFVIFHDPDHGQTFDCCMDSTCFGLAAYMTGNVLENPEDSEKTCIEAVFPNGMGPALTITSSGNIIGSYVSPRVDRADKVARWILRYLGTKEKLTGSDVVTTETVARAIEAFETTADDVWAAYKNHSDDPKYNAEAAFAVLFPGQSYDPGEDSDDDSREPADDPAKDSDSSDVDEEARYISEIGLQRGESEGNNVDGVGYIVSQTLICTIQVKGKFDSPSEESDFAASEFKKIVWEFDAPDCAEITGFTDLELVNVTDEGSGYRCEVNIKPLKAGKCYLNVSYSYTLGNEGHGINSVMMFNWDHVAAELDDPGSSDTDEETRYISKIYLEDIGGVRQVVDGVTYLGDQALKCSIMVHGNFESDSEEFAFAASAFKEIEWKFDDPECGKINYFTDLESGEMTDEGRAYNCEIHITPLKSGTHNFSGVYKYTLGDKETESGAKILLKWDHVSAELDDPQPSVDMLGDVDGDGEITANDAIMALRMSIGAEKYDYKMQAIADVDGDEEITANDAIIILRASIGIDNLGA